MVVYGIFLSLIHSFHNYNIHDQPVFYHYNVKDDVFSFFSSISGNIWLSCGDPGCIINKTGIMVR